MPTTKRPTWPKGLTVHALLAMSHACEGRAMRYRKLTPRGAWSRAKQNDRAWLLQGLGVRRPKRDPMIDYCFSMGPTDWCAWHDDKVLMAYSFAQVCRDVTAYMARKRKKGGR